MRLFLCFYILTSIECILKYTIIQKKIPYIQKNITKVKHIFFEKFTDDNMRLALLLF